MDINLGNRKIQTVRYSYLVHLPVYWVKNASLTHGDSVKFEMLTDKSLRITPVLARHDREPGGSTPSAQTGGISNADIALKR